MCAVNKNATGEITATKWVNRFKQGHFDLNDFQRKPIGLR